MKAPSPSCAFTSGWRSRRCTSASGQKITNAVAPAMAAATNSRAKNMIMASELRIPRRARVGDRVADVGPPAHVHRRPLETQAEARVGHAAVAAEVAVPAVVRGIQAELRHARVEHVQPLLAPRAAD